MTLIAATTQLPPSTRSAPEAAGSHATGPGTDRTQPQAGQPGPAWPEDRVSLSAAARGAGGREAVSPEEQRQVDDLKRRDQEVKAHEQAHTAAGAGLVSGGASYEYQRGPDGRMYAVGGEVQIDVSAENDPDATIRKMQQVRRAALAPSQPSGADRAVAARATQLEMQARSQKQAETAESAEGEDDQGRRPAPAEPGTGGFPAIGPTTAPAAAAIPRIDIHA